MIDSLVINGYRCFRHLEMGGLGRVNLLVGRNNSGKTSVLEALYLLASAGDPTAVWRIVNRRGERVDLEPAGPRQIPDVEMDLTHLFHGHDMKLSSRFSFQAKNSSPPRSVSFSIQEATVSDQAELSIEGGEPSPSQRLLLSVQGTPKPAVSKIPLSARGGLRFDTLSQRPRRARLDHRSATQYISTESLSVDDLVLMWNDIVLTDSEERVLTALRFLEPNIERLAVMVSSATRYYYSTLSTRGGFKVKLRNVASPIPIGSLGDGTWRMLALAISLIRAKDGVLLIDEIDTGLHYSVMTDMWQMLYKTAREFDVQVFATTHSYDCVQSVAAICDPRADTVSNVTIQRIEIERGKAVPFTEAEIRMAADRRIELR